MNRTDQIKLACVQALEKGLVPTAGGWNREKATALLDQLKTQPRSRLPVSTQPMEVFEVIVDTLADLEDAEQSYVPAWARQLLVG